MSITSDHVIPFAIKPLGVRGRIVRLGAVVDDILSKHSYPDPVSALVAESVSLTAMLGSALKFDGKFILQTKTDGPASMIVADFASPGHVRAMAKFDKTKLDTLKNPQQKDLLGEGYLGMTIDQGQEMERYQGIVP
ncbi:MAG: Hsp33 family molecular chaperone HslO, partial [Pseudomonadota bacterium]|nr:Hsp33 family molecular chaperone HslO [Pseudomonadota bacterium]